MSGPREVKLVFRFIGDGVSPERITAELGLTPAETHAKGAPRTEHGPQTWHTGYWAIASPIEPTAPLERHLEAVLGIIEPLERQIAALRAPDVTPGLFAGIFLAPDGSGTVVLSPGIMDRVARLQLPLEIHLYVDD